MEKKISGFNPETVPKQASKSKQPQRLVRKYPNPNY